MSSSRNAILTVALLASAAPAALAQELPRTYRARPTTGPITQADLMSRLYLIADDSMQGREAGTVGHVKSTDYIARELRRLGLRPGGDSGTYFQAVPMYRRSFDTTSILRVEGGSPLRAGVDYIAAPGTRPVVNFSGRVVFGGAAGDTANVLTPEMTRGAVVVLTAQTTPMTAALLRTPAFQAYQQALMQAAAVVQVSGETIPEMTVRNAIRPREGAVSMNPAEGQPVPPPTLIVTRGVAQQLFGGALDGAAKGQASTATLVGELRFRQELAPARNVIAILPGSDASLRGQYVALGAHSDHVGYTQGNAVDHDSLRLYNRARYAISGSVPRGTPLSAEQQQALRDIRVNMDSVRRVRGTRMDSIRNGADDDGSGTVTLLELAEAFATQRQKPRRSLLFVWHTAEEKGLIGARWFSNNPTVPRDSIVAQLNMDMVGRGDKGDLPNGGDTYLSLVGSRRLSTELGDTVEAVNRRMRVPFQFDYSWDANGHPENIYCRSDHYHYARYGIPVVFFTTGLHGDYHQVTDEPQYIDYPHMTRVAQLVHGVATAVANQGPRPLVDKERPDPNAACRQ